MTEVKELPFKNKLKGISEKTVSIHHDKLYAGYVKKKDEISEKLKALRADREKLAGANQTYSELRALKAEETFAVNGVYLHEDYFAVLGGDGEPKGELAEAVAEKYGSFEEFKKYFKACGLAARGWVVLSWDTREKTLRIYSADVHNQGGVWGAIPVLVLDVYEHAYFIDYGSDRAAYIDDYFANLDWEKASRIYKEAAR